MQKSLYKIQEEVEAQKKDHQQYKLQEDERIAQLMEEIKNQQADIERVQSEAHANIIEKDGLIKEKDEIINEKDEQIQNNLKIIMTVIQTARKIFHHIKITICICCVSFIALARGHFHYNVL